MDLAAGCRLDGRDTVPPQRILEVVERATSSVELRHERLDLVMRGDVTILGDGVEDDGHVASVAGAHHGIAKHMADQVVLVDHTPALEALVHKSIDGLLHIWLCHQVVAEEDVGETSRLSYIVCFCLRLQGALGCDMALLAAKVTGALGASSSPVTVSLANEASHCDERF